MTALEAGTIGQQETAMGRARPAWKVWRALAAGKPVIAAAAIAVTLAFVSSANAQPATVPASTTTDTAAPTADNAVMLTVFFKHDQSRPPERTQRGTRQAGILQGLPARRCRSRQLVRDDGNWPGHHAAASGKPAARGQPDPGKYRVGQLSHRILPDLRLQADRFGLPRKSTSQISRPPNRAAFHIAKRQRFLGTS